MEGCGNDFVVVYRHALPAGAGPSLALDLCDRSRGIGADGVLVVDHGPSLSEADIAAGATARMTVWNADGSIAEMCGNGLRCVARKLDDDGQLSEGRGTVATGAGLMPVERHGEFLRVAVGFPGLPEGSALRSVSWHGHEIAGLVVSVGNPHFVVFADEAPAGLPDIKEWGPDIEVDDAFPNRTNVELARVDPENRGQIEVRVWERGVGETQACGSGACAVAVAAVVRGHSPSGPLEILLPGGALRVDWPGREGEMAFIEGPATTEFSGEWRGAS
jgi:diaminopimelate epimerase